MHLVRGERGEPSAERSGVEGHHEHDGGSFEGELGEKFWDERYARATPVE